MGAQALEQPPVAWAGDDGDDGGRVFPGRTGKAGTSLSGRLRRAYAAGARVHYALGYSGHGVGPSWLAGQALASLATDADDEWTRLPLVHRKVATVPPEPFRRLGGGAIRAAILACEQAAEAGRRAPLPARIGAWLPRALGMRLGQR